METLLLGKSHADFHFESLIWQRKHKSRVKQNNLKFEHENNKLFCVKSFYDKSANKLNRFGKSHDSHWGLSCCQFVFNYNWKRFANSLINLPSYRWCGRPNIGPGKPSPLHDSPKLSTVQICFDFPSTYRLHSSSKLSRLKMSATAAAAASKQCSNIFCKGGTIYSIYLSLNISYRTEGCLQLPWHFVGIITGHVKKKSGQATFGPSIWQSVPDFMLSYRRRNCWNCAEWIELNGIELAEVEVKVVVVVVVELPFISGFWRR